MQKGLASAKVDSAHAEQMVRQAARAYLLRNDKEAGRLRTITDDPVNVSKSSLRLTWRPRAVATALLQL